MTDWETEAAIIRHELGIDPGELTLGRFLDLSRRVIPAMKASESKTGPAFDLAEIEGRAIREMVAKMDWLDIPLDFNEVLQ